MGAKRAAPALGVAGVGEAVRGEVVLRRPDPGELLLGERHERQARAGAADHGLGEPPALLGPAVRLPVEELPEAADVLMELAEHEIAAVAAEVAPLRHVLGRRQVERARIMGRVEQRPVGMAAVLVAVAEHDLARRHQVGVFGRLLVVGREQAPPVDARLAQPVGEAERLDLAHVEGRQALLQAKGPVPFGPLDGRLPGLEPAGPRVEHQDEVGHGARPAAPGPRRGRVAVDVAEAARAPGVARHAARELVRKALDDALVDAERPQALAGEGHLERGRGRRVGRLSAGHPCAQQPVARGPAIGDLEQKEARLGEPPVAEAQQALHVGEVDRGGRAHSRLNQARASRSVTSLRSRPSRILALRARSIAVRPG